jgi:hypothetical protein
VAGREIAKVPFNGDLYLYWTLDLDFKIQSLQLDALQMCEILACGPVAPLIPFHQWWNLVTTIKHFKSN